KADLVGMNLIGDDTGNGYHLYGMTGVVYENQGHSVYPPVRFRPHVDVLTITVEDTDHDPGSSMLVNALFRTAFGPENKRQTYQYNIQGQYSPQARGFDTLRLVVANPDLGPTRPAAMAKCPAGTLTVSWGRQEHAALDFDIDSRAFHARGLDCIARAVPKNIGDELRYLVANFNSITADMVKSGNADDIENDWLKQWIGQAVTGEVKVLAAPAE
ncbi:MAG TPA: hypothetical protein VG672_05445, partial [Bryobacteraceae bacterium]|nr:hypothetical protein [Bryobacteraceae bacterium]